MRTEQPGNVEQRWAIPALVAGVVCLVYSATLAFSFVYDDNFQIVDNAWLTSTRYIPRFFTAHVWAFADVSGVYWRPLFLLWLFLQRTVFGLTPAAWHAATVAMHAASSVLVYLLVRRITADRATGVLAAMIFGLHPALLESVAWISGVSDPLLAVTLIPALLFYLRWQESRSARALAWSIVFYALALLAKEPAVMLLPLVAAHAWLYRGGDLRGRIRKAFAAALPYLPLTAVYLVFHAILFARAAYPNNPATPWRMLLTAPKLLVFYLRLLVWPAPISPEYPLRPVMTLGLTSVLLPVVALIAVAVLLWFWSTRLTRSGDARGHAVAYAGIWIFVLLAPVLYIKPLDSFDFAHARYLYLPCIGFATLLAMAIRMIPADERNIGGIPARQFGAALVVILALAAANAVQQVHWASNLLLFTRGVNVAPNNPTALTMLGIELGKREQYPKAIALLKRAIDENPNDWHQQFSLGYTYLVMGLPAQAEPLIERAVKLRAGEADPDQWAYLGMAALRNGDLAKAEWAVRNAIRRRSDVARYHHALALILEQQHRTAEAAAEFRETLKYDPSNADAKQKLGQKQ
jgi:Flp pilus assembly protein TadD